MFLLAAVVAGIVNNFLEQLANNLGNQWFNYLTANDPRTPLVWNLWNSALTFKDILPSWL